MLAVIDRLLLWWRCCCRNLRVSHAWLRSITNASFLCTIRLHASKRVNSGSKCAPLLVATPDAFSQRRVVNAIQQKKVQALRERDAFVNISPTRDRAHALREYLLSTTCINTRYTLQPQRRRVVYAILQRHKLIEEGWDTRRFHCIKTKTEISGSNRRSLVC